MGENLKSANSRPCPNCGQQLEYIPDCPGYPSREGTMVCFPECGNAQLLDCRCGYWYRWPNNRSTTDWRGNIMGERPTWFEEWE